MTTPHTIYILLGALALLLLVWGMVWFYRHQCLLAERAHLMSEAIRNRDFTFRLPTKHLFFGERALQETVNNFSKDISQLVAQSEVESWQRLIRVLTHEIMNAATPISSISQAYLSDHNIQNSNYEEGIRAIYQSSQGMTTFIQNFRKITSIQEPVFTQVNMLDICNSLRQLFSSVDWSISENVSRAVLADESMLIQVLCNLAKNAIEAGAKHIDLRYHRDALCVSNDGAPIPSDVAQEIFTPFFTTKRSGSGIGLSLSRQMMLKQGMYLMLAEHPVPGYHTTFMLTER